MNALITLLFMLLTAAIMIFLPSVVAPYEDVYGVVNVFYCAKAILFGAAMAGAASLLIRRIGEHGAYLVKLFALAVLLRILIGTLIFAFNGQGFFGGDALTYDYYGYNQMIAWAGDRSAETTVRGFIGTSYGSGWGMVYLIGAIYSAIGRNALAIQYLNAVLGAATAPVIFLCALEVFRNQRVAKIAGLAVAFYPSLVLWSSQGLKDAPIVFCLSLCILATLKLGQKLSPGYMAVLVVSLFCLLSLRFYVFYMIMTAIVGAFLIGMRALTVQSLFRQIVVMVFLGLSLTYLGVTRYANIQFENYGTLDQVQRSRLDAATSAQSGFGQDYDTSTASGALSTIPIGMLYLLFAPFPWELSNLRQTITLPEMIIWWTSFPLLALGLWYTLKMKLRPALPILIFTTMLTIAYSVFQGNVGTAYRQRAQLLVFYFIFVAVGYELLWEKRQDKKRLAEAEERASKSKIRIPSISPSSVSSTQLDAR